jgi:hypothetical protein
LLHFGTLVAHPGADASVIANDIRLAVWCDGEAAYAALACDREAVAAEFVKDLFDAFRDGKLLAATQSRKPARG